MSALQRIPDRTRERRERPVASLVGARLSVVVLATSDVSAVTRAVSALAPRCRDLDAELLVVSSGSEPLGSVLLPVDGVRFFAVPATASLAEMRELGMLEAIGDIVAIREDVAVGDGAWIDAFRRLLVDDGWHGDRVASLHSSPAYQLADMPPRDEPAELTGGPVQTVGQ
jgi:hypothetical protein